MEREQAEDKEKIYKSLTSTVIEIQREHVKLKKSLAHIEQDQVQLREMIGRVQKLQEELRETMFGIHQDHTEAVASLLQLQKYHAQTSERLFGLEQNQAALKISLAALANLPPHPNNPSGNSGPSRSKTQPPTPILPPIGRPWRASSSRHSPTVLPDLRAPHVIPPHKNRIQNKMHYTSEDIGGGRIAVILL